MSAPDKYAECRGHTPGEWTVMAVVEDRFYGEGQRALYVIGGDESEWASGGRTIAVVGCWEDRPNPDADAALLRRAPSLLADYDALRAENEEYRRELESTAYGLESAARMLRAIHENDPSQDRLTMAERTESRAKSARDLLSRHQGES